MLVSSIIFPESTTSKTVRCCVEAFPWPTTSLASPAPSTPQTSFISSASKNVSSSDTQRRLRFLRNSVWSFIVVRGWRSSGETTTSVQRRKNTLAWSREMSESWQQQWTETGGLFGLAVRLMQLFSENKSDFTGLIGTLGLYFQIRDDYANLVSKEYTENKSFAEDLTEGKFSFPIINAIQTYPDDPRMMSICCQLNYIIRKRTTDIEIKKYAIDILDKLGSFDHTKRTLQELDAEAREEAESHGHNPVLIQVLDELRTW
ncbi:terpene synthase-like isoform X7 [Ornithodoros turicata]|uniref:terpene synthase-like isoform X7 n=1 Tax=Ornithodoros turicata TaxID=34597 RepID=UPI0031387DD2